MGVVMKTPRIFTYVGLSAVIVGSLIGFGAQSASAGGIDNLACPSVAQVSQDVRLRELRQDCEWGFTPESQTLGVAILDRTAAIFRVFIESNGTTSDYFIRVSNYDDRTRYQAYTRDRIIQTLLDARRPVAVNGTIRSVQLAGIDEISDDDARIFGPGMRLNVNEGELPG
ncbi:MULTISPECIES: hypothetical protein [Actinomycetes]|uniref:hypothetical protein n=1 Tax=Actinomycetes TaxID=1760 RepID=UPI00131A03C3|nr:MULTISPECIES: hypothetical protein [Actinomycetes]